MVNNNGTTRTYNAANQMVNDGTNTLTYDSNGNLTSDGVNSYTWDRANRMLTAPGNTSYKYDGLGNRIQQTVSATVTDYLLDTQPGLVKVLGDSDGNRYVHGVRGVHASEDNLGNWEYMAQDGLGSVRGIFDDTATVQSSMSYDPYGNPMGGYGAGFGFTGEMTDDNDLLYLRARYYSPEMGVWTTQDFLETPNRYGYVSGDPINFVDPTGLQGDKAKEVGAACLAFIAGDGPFPFGDAACVTLALGTGIYSLYQLSPGVFHSTASRIAGTASDISDFVSGVFASSSTSTIPPIGSGWDEYYALRLSTMLNNGTCNELLRSEQLPQISIPQYVSSTGSTSLTDPRVLGSLGVDVINPADLSDTQVSAIVDTVFAARRAGPRITWVPNYNAGRDSVTGACLACKFAGLANVRFGNVNTGVTGQHGCSGDHIHVFKFNQLPNCDCIVQKDDPDVRCLSNPYAGPSGGPHFLLTNPSVLLANPELSICTGGWIVT